MFGTPRQDILGPPTDIFAPIGTDSKPIACTVVITSKTESRETIRVRCRRAGRVRVGAVGPGAVLTWRGGRIASLPRPDLRPGHRGSPLARVPGVASAACPQRRVGMGREDRYRGGRDPAAVSPSGRLHRWAGVGPSSHGARAPDPRPARSDALAAKSFSLGLRAWGCACQK